ncbi:MAG: hypothetical protein KGJ70_00150 [Gemmatimonadota bacterium]|nr:hypothetical protein [Gemmatimonadota bacterium]
MAPMALAAGALLAAGSPAGAQVANQSDVTGIPITSSSVVSPVFTVAVGGAARVITFTTPQIAVAYQQAAGRINAQLSSQTFTTQQGFRAPPATQNLLYEVVSGGTGSAAASAQLLDRLTAGNASPQAVSSAQAFVESFRGLLAKGIDMKPQFFNSLTATQLANSVAAYNAFIDASPAGYLSAPPPEVMAVRGILAQLTAH